MLGRDKGHLLAGGKEGGGAEVVCLGLCCYLYLVSPLAVFLPCETSSQQTERPFS